MRTGRCTGAFMTAAQLAWDCQCELGEGALWNAPDQSLYFVDIKGCVVLAWTPSCAAQRRWPMPQMAGWLVPRRAGGWLAGLAQGPVALQLGAQGAVQVEWLHRLHRPDSPLRLNDAKVDARGRLWFGSMNHLDETQPQGLLYRWEAGSDPVVVDAGYGVTNGPAFSPDGRTLYHTDSLARTVYAFDLSDDGVLSRKRAWLRLDDDEGFPDGMTTDADGCLWIAHWGASRVTQRDATGRILRTVALPVAQVTNVAFGGPQLRDLFITTARTGMDAAALAAAPLAGALFVAPDVGQGTAAHAFAG